MAVNCLKVSPHIRNLVICIQIVMKKILLLITNYVINTATYTQGY